MAQQQPSSRLDHPTQYHLMTGQQQQGHSIHPLTDSEMQHGKRNSSGSSSGNNIQRHSFQQDLPNLKQNDYKDNIEFNDSFSQTMMNSMSSPLHDYDEYQHHSPIYNNNRNSFSSIGEVHPMNTAIPMDIHRRSSTATDVTLQSVHSRNGHQDGNLYNQFHPMYPSENNGSLGSAHSMAMSAPANMNYNYNYPMGNNRLNSKERISATAAAPAPQGSSKSSRRVKNSSADTKSLAKSYEEEDCTTQVNMQYIIEKRTRRRESHNAVERRRRDNINDRIQDLCSLLPETALENATVGPNNKPNKGTILKKSVDYIRELQQQVNSYHRRVEGLENSLEMYRQQEGQLH